MTDKNQDDATLKEKYPKDFGEKLKARREEMGISVSDAASRMHLSPRFVTMLENEDLSLSTLPAIYLRGYLRSYSKLLNISDSELSSVLERLNPTPPLAESEPVTAAAAATESLSIPYPLENNSYYTRAVSLIISLGLLTSLTAWWYLHANNTPAPTLIALEQPVTTVNPATNEVAPPPAVLNTNITPQPVLQTAAQQPTVTPTQAANTGVDLAANKSVTLATAEPAQPLPTPAKPVVKQNNNDEEEPGDEQE